MDPLQVCEAVIERLTPVLPDWHLKLSEPSPSAPPWPLPYAIVELAPAQGADYVQVDGDWTKWFIRIVLYANAADHEASLRFMAPLLGTKGPILATLKDAMADYNDALSELSYGLVQPTTLSGFKIVNRDRAWLRTATIAVTIGSN